MGNIDMSGKYHFAELIVEYYNENKGKGDICGFYSATRPIYMIMSEELVKFILIKDFNYFVNRGMYWNEKDEPMSANLVFLEDDRWRFARNKLSPAFTSGKLKAMYPTMIEKSKNLKNSILRKLNKVIEVKDLINRFTADIISSVAFGMEANTLNDENEKLIKSLEEINEKTNFENVKFLFASIYPDLARKFHIRMQRKNVEDFFIEIIESNLKYREDTKNNRNDLLNMLIQLKNNGSIDGEISTDFKKLTHNEILAEAFLFFTAGVETSSSTISYALAELGRNEEIQEKLRKEIEEKTKLTNGEISYEALHEMKYLTQIVDETLRMYPPGFIHMRIASNDYKVPDSSQIIPKGSHIWIPTFGLHYDEEFWTNPKKFDPERFTKEEIEKRSPYVYLPFGEGPRNCIGMRFAQVTVKLAIASIVQNFKVILDSKTSYPFKFNPNSQNLDVLGGFWVKFEKL